MCRAAASSVENPRSSNTFRSLPTFLLLLLFHKRLVFSGFHVLKTFFGKVNVLLRSLIRCLRKSMQNINPTSVEIVQETVPKVLILVSQLTNTRQDLAHWFAIQWL